MSLLEVRLNEWETLRSDQGSPLAKLGLSDEESRRTAQQLSETGQIEVLELARGLEIRARSFVGRVTLGQLTITVRPKIDGAPLLNLLRYAYGLRDLHLFEPTGYASRERSFQDLFIHLLISEIGDLIARGLHRDYKSRSEELHSPKGRIEMNRIARMAGRVATLPCTHFPVVVDHALNRALLAGLTLSARLTTDVDLLTGINRLRASMREDVTRRPLDSALLGEALLVMDRRTAAYRPALTLIGLLRQAAGVDLEGESDSLLGVRGFLFDMNRFFQALVLRLLRDNLSDCEVRSEKRLTDMFAYDPERNPKRRQAPIQRPDFVIEQSGKAHTVLDAKYRDLWETPLPRDMLYQLALYALGQPGDLRAATILYPTLAESARDQIILVREPIGGAGRAHVALRPINLLGLERALHEKGPQARRNLEKLTRWLAFGAG